MSTTEKRQRSKNLRALFLVNHKARRGRENLAAVRERLTQGGLTLIEPDTESTDFLTLVRHHREEADCVIVGGGDGTIHRAASGLLESKLPLGILPLGTANDLARTLQIPTDPLTACDIILDGITRSIDIGIVNDEPFFNVASIGLAAEVTRRLSRGTKTYWGVLAYAWAAMGAMLRGRAFSVEIRGNGQSLRTRTWQIAVGNGRYYGGGLSVHENARIDDGLLNLYSVEIKRRWQVLPLIPALWRGTLDPLLPIRTLRGTEFEIRPLHRARSIIADGEFIGSTPAIFKMIPHALSVYAPQVDA
jgi:diacylglycerol kinase (ATP)